MTHSADALQALKALAERLGPQGWWQPGTAEADQALQPHLTDWRQRYSGKTLAMARPLNTAQVVDVVSTCAAHGISIVPQGGNTSLVGGSVPDSSGTQLLLNLQRMQRIRHTDAGNLSLVAEAGCTLEAVQAAANAQGLLFPLSLASEGSCTIGGNLATNAGGTQVLRYGTARELCLGLEAVMADGRVWNGLTSLRKDNSGYALKDLLVGSEGTLGIITAASLKLYPKPAGQACALVACQTLEQALELLKLARQQLDAGLVAFEAMAQLPAQLLMKYLPQAAACLKPLIQTDTSAPPRWTLLVEVVSAVSDAHADQVLAQWLEGGMINGLALTGVMANSRAQQQAMWHMRESIPLAEKAEGRMVKHDIAVPTSSMAHFVATCGRLIAERWPLAQVVCFGHLGDGNLHYNVQPAPGQQEADFETFEAAINAVVFEQAVAMGGTISAEHGIGLLRSQQLTAYKDATAMQLMHQIKRALDPQNLLNPSRVLRCP